MHIIVGLFSILVTVFYLLDRMGIDLAGLNPWSWRRRRNWRNQFKGDPIYAIEDPISVASLLVVGAAKLGGDLTAEQKSSLLEQFETRFSVSRKEASELLVSSGHLFGGPQVIDKQLEGLLKRHNETFTDEQLESVLEMISSVVAVGGPSNELQRDFLANIQSNLSRVRTSDGGWT